MIYDTFENMDLYFKPEDRISKAIQYVTVKEAMGEFAARCLPPKLTSKLIYKAAENLISSPPDVQPLKFEPSVEMQIELAKSDYREKLKVRYP